VSASPAAATKRPSIEELRKVAQPDSVLGRVSGEHWAGRLYLRHISIHLTRALVPTRVSPDGLTAFLIVDGIAAAVVLTIPHWWAAVIAAVLIQIQGLVDCMDGELARWRQRMGPIGIYLDRIAHYVTDAGLAVAVGVHAGGGLGHNNGWTTIGLCAGFVVLVTKAETDLVHTSRALSGRPPTVDTAAVAQPHATFVRRLRRLAGNLPFNRALLAMELTGLALVASIIDASRGGLAASRVLDVALLVIAGIVVVGHLLSIVTSDRLR
jgi:phosphatidylglycerophosphate synthase